jgi:tripartite-type tricarboxylate transporter receptor subunit TctC
MPDVPTFAEAGMPEYTAVGWYGLMAPAGTPPEIVAKLSEAANKVIETPEVIEALAKQGIVPYKNSPEDFAAIVQKNLNDYRALVTKGLVKIQ